MYAKKCHISLNLSQSGPEIDPFWYVGRGVRPIGRFGKRQSGSSLQPVVKSLELLLNTLRNKESLQNVLAQEESDWLPWDLLQRPVACDIWMCFSVYNYNTVLSFSPWLCASQYSFQINWLAYIQISVHITNAIYINK